MPTQLHAHTQPTVKLDTARETRTSIRCLKTVNASILSSNTPSDPQKLKRLITSQVGDLFQPPSWMINCPTVHSGDQLVTSSSGNQCTYTDKIK